MYSHYVGPNLAIVGDDDGFGVVSCPDNKTLIRPVYQEVLPLDLKVKTLLVYERRGSGCVIGIYSVSLREWLHRPQFTHVSIKNSRTLNVYIGRLHGLCDIATGDITWSF